MMWQKSGQNKKLNKADQFGSSYTLLTFKGCILAIIYVCTIWHWWRGEGPKPEQV